MRDVFRVILVIEVVAVVGLIALQEPLWMLNFQLAFIGSFLVIFASFFGYRALVLRSKPMHNRDIIDTIDDKFDLYEEEESSEQPADFKEAVALEREKLKSKKVGLKNLYATKGGFLSIYRLGAYAIFVLSFLWLVGKDFFHLYSYVAGLIFVPITVLIFNFTQKGE